MRFFRSPVVRVRALGLLLTAVVAISPVLLGGQPARAAVTFVVNGIGDASDADLLDGLCDAQPSPGSQCSLRAAIEQANALAGADTINFAIPGGGVRTIRPSSQLPPITEQVTINGYSQPGASPNTLTRGTNAVLRVELSSVSLSNGRGNTGLTVQTSNTLIRGLVISGWTNGVVFSGTREGTTGNRITGCFIGTDAAGTAAPGNKTGIVGASATSTIGGDSPATRNLIAGNADAGVLLVGATEARVLGNLIGTDRTGNAALENGVGVVISGGANNVIGGDSLAFANVIAYNDIGVVIESAAAIGGEDEATGIQILRNAIYASTQLGIDLDRDGPTANDAGDADTGSNNLQNKPVLTADTTTTVRGTLNSLPARQYAIRLYSNPPGGDEGRTFRGGPLTITTGPGGNTPFTFTVSPSIPAGHSVTATATDVLSGDTSEFSLALTVTS